MKCDLPGLNNNEVQQSRNSYGTNQLAHAKKDGFFKQFLSNFGDPIIKVLLAALAVNFIFLLRGHDWYETIGIAVAVFLATLVSTISEYGSETAFENLQREASKLQCRVRRNNITLSLPIDELVIGDIVLLQAGESIPADGRLMRGHITVDQSAINGESVEVEKTSNGSESIADPYLSPTLLLRGSVVCSGEAIMAVTQVGDRTVYGKVATEIQQETRESPLKLRLSLLAKKLSTLGFAAGACVAISDLFHSIVMENGYSLEQIWQSIHTPQLLVGNLLHALMLAITVVVVAVPEGLPMMITVVLSSNMRRMLKDHVLVRKLVGIETSGSLNILFTDKTGTLTVGKPSVSFVLCGDSNEYRKDDDFRKTQLWEWLSLSGFYNTDCEIAGKDILGGNSTDRALLSYIRSQYPINTECEVLNKLPFNSDRKWSACEINSDRLPSAAKNGFVSLYKGAPDRLLPLCTHYMDTNEKKHPFYESSSLFERIRELEDQSMRLVALLMSDQPITEKPSNLVLIGIAVLSDEIRRDVRRSVTEVKQAGIQVVMITGDSRQTATSIALKTGIIEKYTGDSAIITGDEMSAMSDDELRDRLRNIRVIARALPSDKSRLVRLAQQLGMVVGMTGDGINDAPALKIADVGFSMGSGTQIAKQASDIVILNDHFSSIGKAILYGRTIFKSIRKFIVFQLTMNLCAVGISVLGPFIGVDTPVTMMQMLWINIIMDTLAGLAFAGEAPLAEYMKERPKERTEAIVNRYMLSQILVTGLFTVCLCAWFLRSDLTKQWFRYDVDPLFWLTAFFALFIFCGIFNSFSSRTTRLNLLSHLMNNYAFLITMSVVSVVQILLMYWGGYLFRTAPLTGKELLLAISLASTVIPVDWLRKVILRLKHRKGSI